MSSEREENFRLGKTPDDIESSLLAVGLRPELISSLAVDDALFMIAGVTKLMEALAHPDRGHLDSVFGMDISAITQLRARLSHFNKDAVGEVLDSLDETSVLAQARREREILASQLDTMLSISETLADEVLQGPERLSETTNMQLFIYPFDATFDSRDNIGETLSRRLEKEALLVTIRHGVVTNAVITPAEGSLITSLPESAQELFESIRPSIDNKERSVFVDKDRAEQARINPGWYKLLNATSKNDRSKKRLAVKRYDPTSTEAYPRTELLGARLIGYLTGVADNSILPDDPHQLRSVAEFADKEIATKSMSKFTDNELAYMLARGVIAPLQAEILTPDTREAFVFRKGFNSNYIPNPATAVHIE